jgi:hypothetical protein
VILAAAVDPAKLAAVLEDNKEKLIAIRSLSRFLLGEASFHAFEIFTYQAYG